MIDWHPAPASLPERQRIYAIGDVHGCADRLRAIHGWVAADLGARPVPEPLLLHIGDYIDRGPDSAGVLDTLLHDPVAPGLSAVSLMGNHEDMLLRALAAPEEAELAQHWLFNGGDATLASWGLDARGGPAAWLAGIPPDHLALLRRLVLRHDAGGYLFVHAGIRPGVALAQQSAQDLMWIREPFLSSHEDFGMVVVHGHTPLREPAIRPNRVGIDTGAVMGGRLTCAVFERDKVGFISR
jgi:serine/threonine protein phosphatase 1